MRIHNIGFYGELTKISFNLVMFCSVYLKKRAKILLGIGTHGHSACCPISSTISFSRCGWNRS